MSQRLSNLIYCFLKRMIDIICCMIAFPFFVLILIVLYIAIKIEDGGAIFYRAPRIGKNSKKFYMWKFRSMKENAPDIRNEDGSTFNSSTDLRVTKTGKFLRESSIDETAQILNVLKGDMSIIGPRASAWDVLDTYKEDEIDKMKVRPGITGYCQAYFRNGISTREKRLKDAWYANNMSFMLDIKIFFKTIQTILRRKNIYNTNNLLNDEIDNVNVSNEKKEYVEK